MAKMPSPSVKTEGGKEGVLGRMFTLRGGDPQTAVPFVEERERERKGEAKGEKIHRMRLQPWHLLQNLPDEAKVVFIKSINIHVAW